MLQNIPKGCICCIFAEKNNDTGDSLDRKTVEVFLIIYALYEIQMSQSFQIWGKS